MEQTQQTELSLRNAYKAVVEEWITAIREEEALAFAQPTVREVDIWERAHMKEDELRNIAKQAKKNYEGAIREELFHF